MQKGILFITAQVRTGQANPPDKFRWYASLARAASELPGPQ
jgi:hypothetical protein